MHAVIVKLKIHVVINLAVFVYFPAISMELQVTSNMDTVLDVAPYNNHILNCAVSHESFAHISGTLMFSFISKESLLHSESKNILDPGPYTAFTNVSESEAGMIQYMFAK